VWTSCERQEYQERRAQRKGDPVAESDLVDVDVGYPGDRGTRNRLFEAASLASIYFWLLTVFKAVLLWTHECTVISAGIRASTGSRKKQQRMQHFCQTRLPHGCQSKPFSGCQRTQHFLSLERCVRDVRAYRGQVFAHLDLPFPSRSSG